jgi:CRP-like cAMP-binding protein
LGGGFIERQRFISMPSQRDVRNQLLGTLGRDDDASVRTITEPVPLVRRDVLIASDTPITHACLSTMLGVRCPGVTTAIHSLEGAGAIKAHRSHLQVLDREKLKVLAGESYGVPEREYRRLIGSPR